MGKAAKERTLKTAAFGETNDILADEAKDGKESSAPEEPSRGGTPSADTAIVRTTKEAPASPSSAAAR